MSCFSLHNVKLTSISSRDLHDMSGRTVMLPMIIRLLFANSAGKGCIGITSFQRDFSILFPNILKLYSLSCLKTNTRLSAERAKNQSSGSFTLFTSAYFHWDFARNRGAMMAISVPSISKRLDQLATFCLFIYQLYFTFCIFH